MEYFIFLKQNIGETIKSTQMVTKSIYLLLGKIVFLVILLFI